MRSLVIPAALALSCCTQSGALVSGAVTYATDTEIVIRYAQVNLREDPRIPHFAHEYCVRQGAASATLDRDIPSDVHPGLVVGSWRMARFLCVGEKPDG